jgi:hypothetical protein
MFRNCVGEKWAYEKRDIVAHHELDFVRQSGALGKVDEIFQRKGERHMLVHLDDDAFELSVRLGFGFSRFRLFIRLRAIFRLEGTSDY